MTKSSLHPSSVAASLTHHRETASVRFLDGSGRAHRCITGFNRPSTPNLVRNQSASHILPAVGKLRTAIERKPNLALAVRPFISRGQRLICNFRGALQGVLSLFPSNPLVPISPKTTCGRFKSLIFSPVMSAPFFHVSNKAWSSQHDAQRNPASSASGASSYE